MNTDKHRGEARYKMLDTRSSTRSRIEHPISVSIRVHPWLIPFYTPRGLGYTEAAFMTTANLASTHPESQTLRAVVSPTPVNVDADTLQIVIMSDLHLPNDSAHARTILQNRPFLRQMDHAILLGDMAATYGTPREYAAINKFLAQLEQPYTAINGNHEFYFHVGEDAPRFGARWDEGSPEEKTAQLENFLRFYGLESLWRAQHGNLGSFIFLGLNGTHAHKAETLSEEQWQFLDEELARFPDKPAYVFCHSPLMLRDRLDMKYYDEERTACVEAPHRVLDAIEKRAAPIFWMSGHIHLRGDHYLFAPYEIAPRVWQVHCPDTWGYSRWQREHITPQRHGEVMTRHLKIEKKRATFVTHDHARREETASYKIEFD